MARLAKEEAEAKQRKDAEMRRVAEIRRQDRERAARNAEYYRKQREKRIEQEREKRELEEERTSMKRSKAVSETTKNWKEWEEDVRNNPDDYNFATRAVVGASNLFKLPVFKAISAGLFTIQNELGQIATSSIDTNGSTIQGKIAQNDIKQQAAERYNEVLDLQKSNAVLEQQRAMYDELHSMDTEYMRQNPNDPQVKQFWEGRSRYDQQIKANQDRINNPETQSLIDAYKEFYVADHTGIGTKIWNAVGEAFTDAITYDYARPELRERRKKEISDKYDKLILDSNNGTTIDDKLQAEQTQLNKLVEKANADNIALRQEYIDNRTHLKESEDYWKIAKGFKLGNEAYQSSSLLNPMYYAYSAAPMIGSSMSSPNQAVASAIKLGTTAAGLALAPFSMGTSTGVMFLGELAATPFEAAGAFDENYAEIGERWTDNITYLLKNPSITGETWNQKDDTSTYKTIIDELRARSELLWRQRGWSEENIKEYLHGEEGDKHVLQDAMSGLTTGKVVDAEGKPLFNDFAHPAFQKAMLYSTAGLQAQWEANNLRTAGSMLEEKTIAIGSFMPWKYLKFARGVKGNGTAQVTNKAANTIERDAAGRVTSRIASGAEQEVTSQTIEAVGRYANGFRRENQSFFKALGSGYKKGSQTGDILGFGYGAHVVGGITGATAKGAVNIAERISPTLKHAADAFEEKALMKYQAVIDRLTPNEHWQQAMLKYGWNASKKAIGTGLVEGAEEGVQYLNSKKDWASIYGWGGASFGDLLASDFAQGGRVLNAYASLFGLSNSELKDDVEFWSNVKGGFALGGLGLNPMNSIAIAQDAINAYKEYTTDNYFMLNTIMDREYNNINRASNIDIAELATKNREPYVIQHLDRIEQADSRRETPNFTQEQYDERRKEIMEVMALAKDKDTRAILEAKGFKYGSRKYNAAIADIYNLKSQLSESNDQLNERAQTVNKLYLEAQQANGFTQLSEAAETRIERQANQAMIDEIDAIRKELGLDPGSKAYSRKINSKEYQDRIQQVRSRAEEQARIREQETQNQFVETKTKLVNKLNALIGVKAKINTIDDFYSLLRNKFSLSTMRPDAKTVRDNIDKQIQDVKSNLQLLTLFTNDQFSINFTDAQVLDYINSTSGVNSVNQEAIQEAETALALTQADNQVIQSYLDQFYDGIVRNKSGKFIYNTSSYNKRKELKRKVNKAVLENKIEEYKELLKELETLENEDSEQESSENNKYSRRVDAILEANKRNQAVAWAVNEVANGDAVNKLNVVLEDEERKAKLESERLSNREQQRQNETTQDPFDTQTTTKQEKPKQTKWEETKEKREAKFSENKKKYQERKARAKEVYERIKKRYKDFKKGSLNVTIVPGQDAVIKAANALMYGAKTTAYKFAQLVEDFKEIAEDVDIKDVLPILKKAYMKRYAYRALRGEDVDVLMSSPEEVDAYGTPVPAIATIPASEPTPLYKKMQDDFDQDSRKIITSISTHYDIIVDDNGTVQIYKNEEAISRSENYYDVHHSIR